MRMSLMFAICFLSEPPRIQTLKKYMTAFWQTYLELTEFYPDNRNLGLFYVQIFLIQFFHS